MIRLLAVLILANAAFLAFAHAAAPPELERLKVEAELRKKPIATAGGEVGDLLRTWWKEGTAAGNAGDFYDNRDRAHSDLDTSPHPQLQRVKYSPEEMKRRLDWALANTTQPFVVFGNSSTSAPPTQGGSNVRSYYCNPRGLPFLYRHYTHNNVYVYPEHRDHDPGHNGEGDGYGDLYPTNTPYLITSQGSSGSDQPFMRALPLTLAAFRPEVKRKLVESGLLVPTVQMIFRSSNKHLGNPKEYLTGKAHPTVFEGSWVDPLKMVRAAHDVRLGTIPPMVQLEAIEETQQANGRDYFEPAGLGEKLADTPAVIARIWRGKDYQRRLIVSAEGSYDLNKRPLTYHWVVLRGDEKKIEIVPRNKAGSVAEIVVSYHPRRPIAPGSAMESNRVDLGVFVHNGAHYSAPGFLTFFSLDSEARTYDAKGRILEVGHGMGEATLAVPDLGALCARVTGEKLCWRVLGLTKAQSAALAKVGEEDRELARDLAKARLARAKSEQAHRQALQKAQTAEKALAGARKEHDAKPAPATKARVAELEQALIDVRVGATAASLALNVADKEVRARQEARARLHTGKRPGLDAAPRPFLEGRLRAAANNPNLSKDHRGDLTTQLKDAPAPRRAAVRGALARLGGLGVVKAGAGLAFELTPLQAGRLSAYEKAELARFHATLLAEVVLPGSVEARFLDNFVDQRLTVPKAWRDVYRYDAAGKLLGWARHDGKGPTDFTADGLLVLEKDRAGRPIRARTVRYALPLPYNLAVRKPLKQELGDELVAYEYDGDKARVKSRTKVEGRK